MEIIRLIVSFLLAIAIGWNILFWLIKRDRSFSLMERLALSYIIGLGCLTLEMFLFSILNIKFSLYVLLLPWLFIFIANIFIFRKTVPIGKPQAKLKNKIFDIALMMGIAFQILHAFFKALIKPMDSFDYIANFAFKAKLFFMKGYIPYELFLNKSIDIQHVDYPLFIPLSETWVYMCLGSWNDLLVKTLFPMFFLALLFIFYFALKRLIGKRLSLVSTFLLATIPHFLNYAAIGYADFALAMFYSASFLYLFLWIAYKRENKYLFLSAALSLLAIWTKREGALLSIINIVILSLFVLFERKEMAKNEIRGIVSFSLIIIVLGSLWFGYMNSLGLSNELINRDTLKLSIAVSNIDRIPLILYEYQKHIFGPKKWNISFLVFFAAFIVYFKRAFTGYFKYITLFILLAFFGYTVFYLFTPVEIRYHLQTSGSRVLLHFLPVVVFWIGYLGREILNGESNIHR